MPKSSQLGTKVESKIDVNFERRFFTKRTLAAAGARSAGLRGSKLGANIDQKSIKKWGQQGKASWHRFLSPSRPIWAPSWPYLGTSGAILVPSWRHVRSPWANFGRILAHLGCIWAHLGSPWRHLGAILAHLGPILAPSWDHHAPKTPQDALKTGILAHLGPILAPSWAHLGPKTPQDAPKIAPKTPPRRPKTLQDGPRRPPRHAQDAKTACLTCQPQGAAVCRPVGVFNKTCFEFGLLHHFADGRFCPPRDTHQ